MSYGQKLHLGTGRKIRTSIYSHEENISIAHCLLTFLISQQDFFWEGGWNCGRIHILIYCLVELSQTNVFSRSFAFVFLLTSLKKSNIFVFEIKFIIEPKRFLSDFKILGPKAISFFSFQIFFLRLQNVLFWF